MHSLAGLQGEMIVEDPLLMPYIQGEELLVKFGTVFFVLIVTGMIKILEEKRRVMNGTNRTSHKKQSKQHRRSNRSNSQQAINGQLSKKQQAILNAPVKFW